MCGILGTWPAAKLSVDFLHHRGPDGSGILALPEVSMGHTRLAILDLSPRGAQPMWSEDGNVLLTYNGEIYNHQRLGVGQHACDTVALAEWLARRGPGCALGGLDGMYAFGAYFRKEKALVLARDPVGIKPLYLAVSANGDALAFASEIKGFFGVEWFRARPNRDAETHRAYLQYGWAAPRIVNLFLKGRTVALPLSPTLIEGVYQLCPGQKLVVSSDGGVLASRTLLEPQPAECLDALTASVNEQSMSDVEVGVQLSGGIDSSLVAYHYALQNSAVHGFYISVRHSDEYNEDCWAHRVADALSRVCNFSFHQIDLTAEDIRQVRDDALWYMDEPALRHPNGLAVYRLCEYVRRRTRIKVLLTGEGADELFGGYSWQDGTTLAGFDQSRRLFDLGGDGNWVESLSRHPGKPVLARQLRCDQEFYLPPILSRQDRMSMAHSIESRVPYLSNRFLAMAPPDKPGKTLLKAEASRVFGREFAERPKCGFGVPWEWLDGGTIRWELLDWLRVDCQPVNPLQRWVMSALSQWAELYLFEGWKRRKKAQ